MKNKINVTAADNELFLLAMRIDATECYELGHIKSGNSHSVDVKIAIEAGDYLPQDTLNGINSDLEMDYTVNIPSGDYALLYSGANWGGPYNFHFKLNEQDFQLKNGESLIGVIWNKGDDKARFTV